MASQPSQSSVPKNLELLKIRPVPLFAALAIAGMSALGIPSQSFASTVQFPTASREDGVYDRLYPRYLEVCAVTQMQNRGGGGGGNFGHATAFIKGACLDDQFYAPATRVKKCRVASEGELANPEMGVGVSTAGEFANIRWIGVQGRQLFFHGKTFQPGEPYNLETSMRDKKALNEAFTTWGVILHEPKDISPAMKFSRDLYKKLVLEHRYPGQLTDVERRAISEYQEVVTNNSVGTDFALSTARNTYCVRAPISEGQLDSIVNYLNSENDRYRDFKETYQWDATKDNCAHMVHDLVWKAGMAHGLTRNLIPPFNFLQIAVPAQEVAILGDKLTRTDLGNAIEQFVFNPRNGWESFGWFPGPLGVVAEFIPARGRKADGSDGVYPQDPQGNEFFVTNAFVEVGDVPGIPKILKKLEWFMLSRETTDVRANLEFSIQAYTSALQNLQSQPVPLMLKKLLDVNAGWASALRENFGLKSPWDLTTKVPGLFKAFLEKYKADLQNSKAEAQAKLKQL